MPQNVSYITNVHLQYYLLCFLWLLPWRKKLLLALWIDFLDDIYLFCTMPGYVAFSAYKFYRFPVTSLKINLVKLARKNAVYFNVINLIFAFNMQKVSSNFWYTVLSKYKAKKCSQSCHIWDFLGKIVKLDRNKNNSNIKSKAEL